MKKTLFVLTMLIGASAFTNAQTADEIINKNIAAMGGLDKLNSIKSVYQEDSNMIQGVKIPIKMWMINKTSQRVEFSFSGMTGFEILRKDSGWSFSPFAGQTVAEPMTPDQVKKGQEELYLTDGFVDYKKKGYTVTFEGKDETEGSESFKIKVKISDSISSTYYIDPDTYYVQQVKSKITENGKTIETSETRSDYKKTSDGYIFPMDINSSMQGDLKVYLIKVNSTIDNKIFSPSVKVAGK